VDVSNGEDLSRHQQEVAGGQLVTMSLARYSRLQCGIRVSPLLPPPFTYREGVLLGRQLRALCLETELEKRKNKSGVSMSVSVPLVKGDRVRTV